jgi:hypothetical protein
MQLLAIQRKFLSLAAVCAPAENEVTPTTSTEGDSTGGNGVGVGEYDAVTDALAQFVKTG